MIKMNNTWMFANGHLVHIGAVPQNHAFCTTHCYLCMSFTDNEDRLQVCLEGAESVTYGLRLCRSTFGSGRPGQADEAVQVNDQADFTVRHNGPASDAFGTPHGLAQALDDDLLLTKQFID